VVEVRKEGKVLAVLGKGAVFGEIAFLLQGRRTADVYAVTPGVRILALRQKALTQLIESESQMAARFLLNLSRILCVKLAGGRMPE
jgi:CRP-like cAMP-binding protein